MEKPKEDGASLEFFRTRRRLLARATTAVWWTAVCGGLSLVRPPQQSSVCTTSTAVAFHFFLQFSNLLGSARFHLSAVGHPVSFERTVNENCDPSWRIAFGSNVYGFSCPFRYVPRMHQAALGNGKFPSVRRDRTGLWRTAAVYLCTTKCRDDEPRCDTTARQGSVRGEDSCAAITGTCDTAVSFQAVLKTTHNHFSREKHGMTHTHTPGETYVHRYRRLERK